MGPKSKPNQSKTNCDVRRDGLAWHSLVQLVTSRSLLLQTKLILSTDWHREKVSGWLCLGKNVT